MSEQLSAAAQAMGVPEPLVERSANAWAAAQGQSVDDVLAAWAGGEAVSTTPAPAEEPPEETEAAPSEEPEAPAEETPAAAPAPAASEPAQPAPAAAGAVTPPPAPETVSPEEALEYPVVVTVPTAGITERTSFSMPGWLSMLLLVVPAFGLLYLALGAGAECGTGTDLQVDRVTGVLENCDGSAFEGRGAGGGGGDFIAQGETIYAQCAGCHGPQGAGQGNFPALTGVGNLFSACTDHIEWVSLGTQGFQAEGRSTYGDTNKPVGGSGANMPAFGGTLTEEQLASVVAFERVRFSGLPTEEVLADCGLVEAEEDGAEGEGGADEGGGAGGEGSNGGDETTETTAPAETDASG